MRSCRCLAWSGRLSRRSRSLGSAPSLSRELAPHAGVCLRDGHSRMNQSSYSRWVASPQRLLSTGSATIGPLPQQRWSLTTSSTIVRMGPQVGHIPSAVLIYIQNSQNRDRVHCPFRHCLADQCRPTRRTRNALPHPYSARRSQADLIQRARSHRIKRRSYLACRVTKPTGSVPWNCSKAFPRGVPPLPRSNPDESYAGCSKVRTGTS